MHTGTDIDLLGVLSYATRIEVPRPDKRYQGLVSLFKYKNEDWIIISYHGPAWYWSDAENKWIIGLASDAIERTTKYSDVVEAFKKATSIESIEEQLYNKKESI